MPSAMWNLPDSAWNEANTMQNLANTFLNLPDPLHYMVSATMKPANSIMQLTNTTISAAVF